MAKMSFSAKNRAADIENFPKIKLAQGESARIVAFEEPTMEYVHNLRAPKMINGVVQYKGEEMDFDFIGNPICLGDPTLLDERGTDPKNCPACEAQKNSPDMFTVPKRKFAMHVFQYQTNGTTKAPAAFEGQVKVWSFADQKFGEIVDIAEESEDTPLDQIDLLLGPCENAMYQKYKIIPGVKTAYLASADTKTRFEQITEANKSKNIKRYIGREMSKDFIADKVDEVKRKWAQAKGQSNETNSDGMPERSLEAGLAGLLDEPAPVKAYSAPVNTPAASSDETMSFDDILKDIEG